VGAHASAGRLGDLFLDLVAGPRASAVEVTARISEHPLNPVVGLIQQPAGLLVHHGCGVGLGAETHNVRHVWPTRAGGADRGESWDKRDATVEADEQGVIDQLGVSGAGVAEVVSHSVNVEATRVHQPRDQAHRLGGVVRRIECRDRSGVD
jgi:hypothetical protein